MARGLFSDPCGLSWGGWGWRSPSKKAPSVRYSASSVLLGLALHMASHPPGSGRSAWDPTAWWSQERCSSCTVLSRSKEWKLRLLSRTGTPSSILNGSKSHRGSPYSRERRKRFHVLMCDEWQVPVQKNTQNGRCGSAHFWKSQFTARGAESG